MLRPKPLELLNQLHSLATELLPHVSEAKSEKLRAKYAQLTAQLEEFKLDGRGRHWSHRRENQLFEVSARGGDSHHVRGFEALAAELGWSISTLRSRFSQGDGIIVTEKDIEGVLTPLTIKRLTTVG